MKVEVFDEVIFGSKVRFEYVDDQYMAEDIYIDHKNGWITEGDTFRGVDTYYECDGCGTPCNGPQSYCYSCGRNAPEY